MSLLQVPIVYLVLVHPISQPSIVSLGFVLSGNVSEWSTLKLMLHIVGWQTQ